MISAIQIEAPKPTIRENQATRSKFAHAMGIATGIFYEKHLGRSLIR
ncbi:MAG: hypothetical protein H8E56_01865 [Candidatus Marinimicrobia bacterium]|nr:hypothetical protein [Candidatus Neomarinimicrobiota bacterium]